MRIISGKYRSMALSEFKGEEIRPTADRVKESLFNILYGRITSARVLDLFCGSGGLGLECISRYAEFVHFNDASAESIAVLRKNLGKLKGENNYKITVCDFSVCLAALKEPFDIIFIDPPYKSDAGISALETIAQNKLLTPEGIAVYERDRAFEGVIDGLKIADERKYGKTYLTFFVRE